MAADPRRIRLLLIALLTGAVAAIIAAFPPFPQPAAYHDFADQRAFLGVPNFLNVASNGLFVLVGAAGWEWARLNGTAGAAAVALGAALVAVYGIVLYRGLTHDVPAWLWWLAVPCCPCAVSGPETSTFSDFGSACRKRSAPSSVFSRTQPDSTTAPRPTSN